MVNFNLSSALSDVGSIIKKHSPEILTGLGIAGMISTTVLAVKATPKALELIADKKREEEVDKLTPVETVKATWKCYIPAAVTGVVSTGCIIGASSVSARRNAALATAYTISESALREYKDKVVETVGEKKEREVRDAIAKDRIDKDPVTNHEIIITGKGETRCYDPHAGRYFYSDIDKLKKIQNEINDRLIKDGYISLNEFYYAIGLEGTDIGRRLGWRVDNGLLELDFSAQLDSDGNPCLVMDYSLQPDYDFDKWL